MIGRTVGGVTDGEIVYVENTERRASSLYNSKMSTDHLYASMRFHKDGLTPACSVDH